LEYRNYHNINLGAIAGIWNNPKFKEFYEDIAPRKKVVAKKMVRKIPTTELVKNRFTSSPIKKRQLPVNY